MTIKPTLTSVHSGNIGAIGTGITKNKLKSMKTGTN